MVYIVGYDLNNQDKDYEDLYDVLKNYAYMHCLDSTWLIGTTESVSTVYNKLKQYIDKNDYLLVIRATDNYRGWLPSKAVDWLKDADF